VTDDNGQTHPLVGGGGYTKLLTPEVDVLKHDVFGREPQLGLDAKTGWLAVRQP